MKSILEALSGLQKLSTIWLTIMILGFIIAMINFDESGLWASIILGTPALIFCAVYDKLSLYYLRNTENGD